MYLITWITTHYYSDVVVVDRRLIVEVVVGTVQLVDVLVMLVLMVLGALQ